MAQKPLHEYDVDEILKYVQSQTKREDRVKALRAGSSGKNGCPLKRVLKAAYDKDVEWQLPEGEVPFTPSSEVEGTARLSKTAQKLHYFVKGGYPNLAQKRREMLFIRHLEALSKSNQLILLYAKDKCLHDLYTAITPDVVTEAFPNLIQNPVSSKKGGTTKGTKGTSKSTNKTKSTSNTKGSQGSKKKAPQKEETYAAAADPEEIEQLDPNPTDED